MDIALLNLANILHRSQHSTDAVVPLLVATSIAPQVNVLHYTLGNVYAVSACVYMPCILLFCYSLRASKIIRSVFCMWAIAFYC